MVRIAQPFSLHARFFHTFVFPKLLFRALLVSNLRFLKFRLEKDLFSRDWPILNDFDALLNQLSLGSFIHLRSALDIWQSVQLSSFH
jgi:hypothetical protein